MKRFAFAAALMLATMGVGSAPLPVPVASAASTPPPPRALPSLLINGVLIVGVEYDTPAGVWRNLGVTVTSDRVTQWRALGVKDKGFYAQKIIDDYRAGTGFAGNIKLTFMTEQNVTLDQYLWTPQAK